MPDKRILIHDPSNKRRYKIIPASSSEAEHLDHTVVKHRFGYGADDIKNETVNCLPITALSISSPADFNEIAACGLKIKQLSEPAVVGDHESRGPLSNSKPRVRYTESQNDLLIKSKTTLSKRQKLSHSLSPPRPVSTTKLLDAQPSPVQTYSMRPRVKGSISPKKDNFDSDGNSSKSTKQLSVTQLQIPRRAVPQSKPYGSARVDAYPSVEWGSLDVPASKLPPPRSIYNFAKYRELPNQYFVGKGNNAMLIIDHMENRLNWSAINERKSVDFKLKWVQCVSSIRYDDFREGEQMVNHIPNISILTTKIGLLESLRQYERLLERMNKMEGELHLAEFFNETYRLNIRSEKEQFLATYQKNEVWICKPSGLNQGIGIFLIRSLEELQDRLNAHRQNIYRRTSANDRIVQRYIAKPLLLENKKIDIRVYMLIASTTPFMVYYHKGYLRRCIYDYDLDSENLTAHLNNQYIQKKDPLYKDLKDDTVWSYEQANDYINTHYSDKEAFEPDWFFKVFEPTSKKIMLHCFHAAKMNLKRKLGFFELLGFDFMIDSELKIYLIEINVNPALATNCEVLDQIIPPVINESLDISIELWEKSRRGIPLTPVKGQKKFETLFNGFNGYQYGNRFSPQTRVQPLTQLPPRKLSPEISKERFDPPIIKDSMMATTMAG